MNMDSNRRVLMDAGSSDPLQWFAQAQQSIKVNFTELLEIIDYSDTLIKGSGEHIDMGECQHKVTDHRQKVCRVMEVLARDHMKVAFFGVTSSGKSTVINAMLSENVLPCGMAHRTHRILQIEGSDSEKVIVLTEREPDTPKSIESIKKLADALKNNESDFVRILFPKTKCRLLRERVVLVDSPGIGVTTELNLWLDKFCLDADVFVLVSDAVATLTQTEKNFFHKVIERLSSPNIFVLLNRWDQSVFEDDVAEVREQHIDRHLEFLCQELNGMDRAKGLERIFFVSAKEALTTRLVEKGEERAKAQLPGLQERHISFCNFERALEECMSKTAVKTKFERNNNLGKSITTENCALVKDILKSSRQHIDRMRFDRDEMAKHLDFMAKQLHNSTCSPVNSYTRLLKPLRASIPRSPKY